MFRKHTPQLGLFQPQYLFNKRLRREMERSWAHVFRYQIFPKIPEDPFRDLYADNTGAPNFPVRILIALSILKELLGLRDVDLVHAFHFNALFHYALWLTPGELTLSLRTLYNFRARIAGHEGMARVFETITDEILSTARVCSEFQRIDSSQITSNMAHLSRLGLFVRTIEAFLKALGRRCPKRLAEVPEALRARYLERRGYFADPREASQARRALEQAAQDLAELIRRFEEVPEVRGLRSYGLLERLFAEQCRVESPAGAAEPVVVLCDPKEISSGSLQNPSDPDATYSAHKGKGYKVQISETCAEANPFQVVTAVAVEPANEGDVKALEPLLEQTERRGCAPKTVVADTSYGGAENLCMAAERGVDLLAPTPGKADPDNLTLMDFDLDPEGFTVRACPEGHEPVRRRAAADGDGETLWFDRARCEACEHAASCPAGRDKGRMRVSWEDIVRAWNRARETTRAFRDLYRKRSGVEGTISELKRAHGMGRVWTRGRDRVTMAVYFKVLACNVKRFARWWCAQAPAPEGAQCVFATPA